MTDFQDTTTGDQAQAFGRGLDEPLPPQIDFVERIRQALPHEAESGAPDSYLTRCPAHDDNTPSLHVTFADDYTKVLLHDHGSAGCTAEEICAAAGLTLAHLFYEPGRDGITIEHLALAKGLDAKVIRSWSVFQRDKIGPLWIPYLPESETASSDAPLRLRHTLTDDTRKNGIRRFSWRKGSKPTLYGLRQMPAIRKAGYVVLVEGETDVWSMCAANVPSLGVPGASAWKTEWSPLLDGLDVFLWKEPGADGLERKLAGSVREVRVIDAPEGVKDPNEAHRLGRLSPAWITDLMNGARDADPDSGRRHRERWRGADFFLGDERCDDDAETAKRLDVDVDGGDLNRVAERVVAALMQANEPPRLFLDGTGTPARIVHDGDGHPLLEALDGDRMRFEVGRAVRCLRSGKATRTDPEPKPIEVYPPVSVVRAILARDTQPWPPVERIVRHPTFGGRSADALRTETGYAAGIRTYVDLPERGLGLAVPSQPSDQDTERARDLLLGDLLGEFPFADEADQANALAFLLLPFGRALITGSTPLHLVESPGPGSGKGKLVSVATILAGGGATLPEPHSEKEWRNLITGKAQAGDEFFAIGNLHRRLDSAALAEALTTPRWQDRLLGGNRTFSGSLRFVWSATANNPTLSSELVRRTVRIRLDAKVDRPWLRSGFRHPHLEQWTAEHRGDLVEAALTLWSAWLNRGCPAGKQTLGSFERWSETLGGILDVAGVNGFLANRDAFYEAADAEGEAWRTLADVWWQSFGSTDVTTSDLLFYARQVDDFPLGDGRTERALQTAFGLAIAAKRDNRLRLPGEEGEVTIAAGLTKTRTGVRTWRLLHTDGREKERSPGAVRGGAVAEVTTANPFAQPWTTGDA